MTVNPIEKSAPITLPAGISPVVVTVPSYEIPGVSYLGTSTECGCPDWVFRHEPGEHCKHRDDVPPMAPITAVTLPRRLKDGEQIRVGSIVMLADHKGARLPAGLEVIDVTISAFSGAIRVDLASGPDTRHTVGLGDIDEVIAF